MILCLSFRVLAQLLVCTGYLIFVPFTCLHNRIPDVNSVQNLILSQISAYAGRVVSVNKMFRISGKDPICILGHGMVKISE